MAVQIASLFASIGADLGPLNKGLRKAQGSIRSAGAGITGVMGTALGVFTGGLMTAAMGGIAKLGGALTGLGKEAVSLATDFQSQMSILNIAASSSGLTLDELHDAALAVGGDISLMGVSASGAADAMTGLFKAGLTSTEIFGDLQGFMQGTTDLSGALRAAIDLAAASELDMVQASDLAAVALATFGGELETEAERAEFINAAMDNMVKAADASVASVSDLAAALKNIGPTAAAFGFSLEDTNNALAVLSTRGIAGAEAGTALKSMLTNIMRPTDQVTGELKKLGVSLFDAEGNMKALPTILGDLESALFGTKDIMMEVGGRTKEQNAQLAELAKAYDKTEKSVSDYETGIKGAGLTEKARAKKIENLKASLVKMGATMGVLNSISGDMVATTSTLTEKQRLQSIQTLAGTFGMKAMQTLLAEGAEGWDAMALATENAAGIQVQAAAKADTFAGKMEALEGTLETLKITAGEALLPILTDLAQNFSEFISDHGPAIVSVIKDVIGVFEPWAKWLANVVGSGDLLNDFLTELPGPFQKIINLIARGNFSDIIRPEAIELWERLGTIAKDLGGQIVPFLKEKLTELSAWFTENQPLIDEFSVLMLEVFGVIAEEVGKMWAFIEPILDLFLLAVLGMAKAIMQMATGDWAGAWLTLQETGQAALKLLNEAWIAFADWVAGWFGTDWASIMETWKTDWALFEIIITKVWDNITTSVQTAVVKIEDWIDGIIDSIKKAVDWAKRLLGIGSPSSVFAEMGAAIPEGLAVGIASKSHLPAQAVAAAMPFPGAMSTMIGSHNTFNINDGRAMESLTMLERHRRRAAFGRTTR